jgi:hypothetical protein
VADSKRSSWIGDGKPKFFMTNLPIGDLANAWYWSDMFLISHQINFVWGLSYLLTSV